MKLVGGSLFKSGLAGLFLLSACGGDGDGEGKVRGTQLVAEAGLKIEDVSKDGSLIAYSDVADKIFLISADGGDPVEVASGVDELEFKGNILVLFSDIDPLTNIAQTLQFVLPGDTTATTAATTGIKVETVRASEDSNHLFFETATRAFLDDVEVTPGDSAQIRGRFTADNQFLVVAFNSLALNVESVVQAFPLAGGAPINLPGCQNGCSSRFQVSNAGQQIIFGANEAGDIADLTVVGANGQGATLLAAQASDNAFAIAEDSETLFFVSGQGELSSIALDGSGLTTLGPRGALDIVAANGDVVVYATTINDDGTLALRIVGADGAGDAALAQDAEDEGLSPSGGAYLFLDGVVGKFGTLKFTDTQDLSTQEVAAGVNKASFQSDTQVFFSDSNDLLQVVDLTSNKATVFEDFINRFELLKLDNGDVRVAFTVPGGAAAGLYVEAL